MKIQLSDHFDGKKLFKFVIPSIIMMVFTSIYGVVDGLFISNLVGKTAFAAVNYIYPFIMILGGIGFMFGAGGSALIAKNLGEERTERAQRYFTMIIRTTAIVAVIAAVIAFIFADKIALLMGADEAILSDCVLYARTIFAFLIFYMLQDVFQSLVVVAEKPTIGLIATVAAGITNMVLDAVLVALMGLGVFGAALATGLGCVVGAVIPFVYFIKSKDCKLKFVKTKLERKPIQHAVFNGLSEFVTTVSSSIVSMFFNYQLLQLAGQDGVSSYGVLMYIQFIFIAIYIGYSIGVAPIIGYNYGAQNRSELRNIFSRSVKTVFTLGVIMLIIAQSLKWLLASIFVGYDQNLFDMTVNAFSISSFVFLFAGFNIFTSSLFTALNNGKISAIVSICRTLVFQIACVLILPAFLGLNGIWLSLVIADILSLCLSMAFVFKYKRKYYYLA